MSAGKAGYRLDPATQVVLTVVTANVGRGVSSARAARNMRAVIFGFARWLRLVVRRNVSIGWQEIDEADAPDEHGILHRLAKRLARGTTWAGFLTATPVGVPSGWRVVWIKVTQTCEGRAGWTPHRVCVAVLMEHERTGVRVLRLNGHWPRAVIEDLWNECEKSWCQLVDEYLDLGYLIAVTCDRNFAHALRLSNRDRATELSCLDDALIDEVRLIFPVESRLPAKARGKAAAFHAGARKTVDMDVDGHNAHGVEVTLTAPPKPISTPIAPPSSREAA